MTTPSQAREMNVKFNINLLIPRHCPAWNRGDVCSDCLKQWVEKHSGADQGSEEKRVSSCVCHRHKNLEGQYPRRGALLSSPGRKREREWHWGLKVPSIWVGGEISPLSPTRSSLLLTEAREIRLILQVFLSPPTTLPRSSLFHFIQNSPE